MFTMLRLSFLSFFNIKRRLITLQYCIGFAIHQHESATGIHMFPIWNPPPTSLLLETSCILWFVDLSSIFKAYNFSFPHFYSHYYSYCLPYLSLPLSSYLMISDDIFSLNLLYFSYKYPVITLGLSR